MTTLYLALLRLGKAIYRAWEDQEFRALVGLMIIMTCSGAIFYAQHEGWSYIDALYFCVMTMSTIGYGDLTPTTDVSKIFTIIYAFITIGLFVASGTKLVQAMVAKPHKSRGKNPRRHYEGDQK